jgi:hypothetical protein
MPFSFRLNYITLWYGKDSGEPSPDQEMSSQIAELANVEPLAPASSDGQSPNTFSMVSVFAEVSY